VSGGAQAALSCFVCLLAISNWQRSETIATKTAAKAAKTAACVWHDNLMVKEEKDDVNEHVQHVVTD
jgi:hypothetical protein